MLTRNVAKVITLVLIFGCAPLDPRVAAQQARPAGPSGTKARQYREWRQFGGGPDNIHYSALDQINRDNVGQLEVAWKYESGDAFKNSEMQCNPIVVDGVLYATTPKLRVIALDAATGRLRWSFDPKPNRDAPGKMRNRGVMYWKNGADARIYFGYRNDLIALDARTGRLVQSFGRGGRLNLSEGLGRDGERLTVSNTTPGVIYKDTIIVGSLVSEALPSAPGHIRAFDARTGRLRWIFHTIPQPGEFGYETWPRDAYLYSGGANSWSGLTLDEERGLVYAPTGSASFDFYGGNRHGDNLFANSLLCLDAATGKRVWHFQAIKHDVWDRDFPAAPALITLSRDDRKIDAVAQITKSGHVYVFDRQTGEPLFPTEQRAVPTDGAPGEKLSETQVLPLAPPPFSRQLLTEDLLTSRTPAARQDALERFRRLRNGVFQPPSFEGTIIFPGFDGGGEWGGAAYDPETSLFYVNANEMAWILRLVKRRTVGETSSGKSLYETNCASCHLTDLRGTPPEFPSLLNIGDKFNAAQLREIIRRGRGRMPGFERLGEPSIAAIAEYVSTGKDVMTATAHRSSRSPIDLEYGIDGYNKFLDPDGYPAVAPPWGTLTAIDMGRGAIAWQIPFGEYPELAAAGQRDTGSENYGGGIVTAGGLFLIGATNYDRKFRAFDKLTGRLLWETELPAAGNATPATYEVNGRQFVVIAAGGGKTNRPNASGGAYVAFALKTKDRKQLTQIK